MPGKAAKVRLSERQVGVLTDLGKSRSVPKFISQRANIILLAFGGQLGTVPNRGAWRGVRLTH
jgi:hypothetical protein